MKKFLILYTSPLSAQEQMDVSPEEMKKGMEPWLAWMKKAKKGLVDGGIPLVNGMHFTKDDVAHSKMQVNGYSIMQAVNWEDLKALIVDHPHYMVPNASIEVFEMMSMM